MFMMFCKKVGLFFRADLFIAFKEFTSKKEGWTKCAFLFKIENKEVKTTIPLTKKIAGKTIQTKVPLHSMVSDKLIDIEAFETMIEMIPLEDFADFLTVEAKKVMFEKREVFAIIFDANFEVAQERLGELEEEKK